MELAAQLNAPGRSRPDVTGGWARLLHMPPFYRLRAADMPCSRRQDCGVAVSTASRGLGDRRASVCSPRTSPRAGGHGANARSHRSPVRPSDIARWEAENYPNKLPDDLAAFLAVQDGWARASPTGRRTDGPPRTRRSVLVRWTLKLSRDTPALMTQIHINTLAQIVRLPEERR
jgi:hypothetical protein